jgi:hypothetical protein
LLSGFPFANTVLNPEGVLDSHRSSFGRSFAFLNLLPREVLASSAHLLLSIFADRLAKPDVLDLIDSPASITAVTNGRTGPRCGLCATMRLTIGANEKTSAFAVGGRPP